MSIWDDHDVSMHWLDSTYPEDQAGNPGTARGPCPTDGGKPADVESKNPNAYVTYGSIKFGEIGSTYDSGDKPDPDNDTNTDSSNDDNSGHDNLSDYQRGWKDGFKEGYKEGYK